jgi:hypothetical protein
MSEKILDENNQKNYMSKINKDWHEKNLISKNATVDQKITWHLDHAQNCNCRPLGGKILEEIKKRKIKI